MSNKRLLKILNDLLEGYKKLNKNDVMKRGLKLSNIIVNKGVF